MAIPTPTVEAFSPPKRLKEHMAVEEGRPLGPTTVAELNQWPAHFFASIRAQDCTMADSLLSKWDSGVVIEFDCSCVGCMEQTAATIRRAVERESLAWPRCFEGDNDPRCRHVLRCHAAEREHCKHSSSDICDRIDSSSGAALQGARRWAAAAKQGALRKGCFRASVG